MTETKQAKRPTCTRCLRPERTCICALISEVASRTQVLILQHPLEQNNAKGSARLLHLCLPNSQLVVGEKFPPEQLEQLLDDTHHNLLLYPADETSSTPSGTAIDNNKPQRLVIIDGTWRKSRKMLHLNPQLAALPRVDLGSAIAGDYRVRKAHKPGQLSTFEAACAALSQLENLDTTPLSASFSGFIEQLERQAEQGRANPRTI